MTPPITLLVFAKAPRAGLAKTRLIPALGPEGAAGLACQLLHHALHQALTADIGPVVLCRTPDKDTAWADLSLPPDITVANQGTGDLGARMARAAERAIRPGRPLLLMGTDCPGLDHHRLRRLANALRHGTDAVMAPVVDGGYAALGLRRHHPSVFEGIAWSTDAVASQTRARILALGWRLWSLPMLNDIDEPSDLRHLPKDWPECRH